MAIIQDDVERLDRLITDISDASRLDAELGRLELSPIDIAAMLRALVEIHETTRHGSDAPRLVARDQPAATATLIVPGIESRLSQVFLQHHRQCGLVQPAASARSASDRAARRPRRSRHASRIEGPGIPEDKLTAIFDRFYTERPAGEKFGTHSGSRPVDLEADRRGASRPDLGREPASTRTARSDRRPLL